MNDSKPFWFSKRIHGAIGCLVVVLAMLFQAFDIRLTELQHEQTTQQIVAVVGLCGWLYNVFGSVVAKQRLRLRTKEKDGSAADAVDDDRGKSWLYRIVGAAGALAVLTVFGQLAQNQSGAAAADAAVHSEPADPPRGHPASDRPFDRHA